MGFLVLFVLVPALMFVFVFEFEFEFVLLNRHYTFHSNLNCVSPCPLGKMGESLSNNHCKNTRDISCVHWRYQNLIFEYVE